MSGKTPGGGGVGVEPARRGRPQVARPPRGGCKELVRIVIQGREAVVVPAPMGLLKHELTTRHRDYRPGGPHGHESGEVVEEQFRFVAPDRLWIAAGLVPRVEALLTRGGRSVEVLDCTTPRPRLRLDLTRLGGEAPKAEALVRAIAARRQGMIAAPRNSRPALIAAVMNAFPEASITVVVAARREAEELPLQLGPLVGEPVVVFTRDFVLSDRRLRICTPGSVDEREADILIFAEAEHVLHLKVADVFDRLVNQHVYGFTSAAARGRASQLAIEGRLGPVIYEVPGAAPRAGVTVLVADTPWAPSLNHLAGLERKRRAIWHADRRNDVVAKVALAVARGDRAALGEHGLLLHTDADPLGDRDRLPSVAVLVESPEHARELARRLPGWPVWAGGTEPDAEGGPDTGPSIMTLVHARRLKRLDIDILVRADGGAGALDLRGFPPRHRDIEGGQVILVDFADDFDPEAREATLGRLRGYEGRRWSVAVPTRWGGRL